MYSPENNAYHILSTRRNSCMSVRTYWVFSYNISHIIICLPATFRVGTYQTQYICPTQNTALCGFF